MAREKSQSIVSSFDFAEDINVVGQYVWDAGSLAWIKAVPSGGGGGGGLTDAELRATPVPVSGPLTDTQLRAVAVPVSGTVTATGPLTDAQLRAVAVPVSGTFFQGTQPISAAALPLPTGAATEATLATRLTESDFDTKTGSLTEVAPGTDTASSGLNGRLQRIAQRLTSLIALLPATLVSGRLDVNIGASPATVPVSGTFFQATQPVSIAATITADVSDRAARDCGKIDVASLDQYTPVSGRLPVDGSGVTQPVSIATFPVDTYTAKTVSTSASGDTTIHDPAPGQRVRLHYIAINADGANSADVTVIIKFGAVEQYKLSLKAGAIWARNIGAGRRYIQGAVDANLSVNLSTAQTVHISIEYEETA